MRKFISHGLTVSLSLSMLVFISACSSKAENLEQANARNQIAEAKLPAGCHIIRLGSIAYSDSDYTTGAVAIVCDGIKTTTINQATQCGKTTCYNTTVQMELPLTQVVPDTLKSEPVKTLSYKELLTMQIMALEKQKADLVSQYQKLN